MPVGKKTTPMKKSPMKLTGLEIMAIASLAGTGIKAYGNWRNSKKQIEQQRDAKKENRERYYENVETIKGMEINNPYAGIQTQFENPYEDLTVNTQQAEFESQQAAQNRANIMSQFGGTAGGSGIAGLAQAMANQATLQRTRTSASIGQQEARNQALAAQGAARAQQMEQQAEQTVAYGEYLRQQGENQRALNLANLQAGYDASKMTSSQNIQALQNRKTSAITGGIAGALGVVGQFARYGGFGGGTGEGATPVANTTTDLLKPIVEQKIGETPISEFDINDITESNAFSTPGTSFDLPIVNSNPFAMYDSFSKEQLIDKIGDMMTQGTYDPSSGGESAYIQNLINQASNDPTRYKI